MQTFYRQINHHQQQRQQQQSNHHQQHQQQQNNNHHDKHTSSSISLLREYEHNSSKHESNDIRATSTAGDRDEDHDSDNHDADHDDDGDDRGDADLDGVVKRGIVNREFIKEALINHPIWRDGNYWEQALWQCVIQQVWI